jgi:hypothetical protein
MDLEHVSGDVGCTRILGDWAGVGEARDKSLDLEAQKSIFFFTYVHNFGFVHCFKRFRGCDTVIASHSKA